MKKLIISIVELLANWHLLTPIRVAQLRYLYIMRKWPHFKHPRDLNEKINYLKFYGDTMKCNNGSGDVLICKDKSKLDIEATKKYFDKMLHRKFGVASGEPHYALIKPCIIAEELLDSTMQSCISSSLIDYKIWCFNGNPHSICCYYNRNHYHADSGIYDLNWQYHSEYLIFTEHYKESKQKLPKPVCLEKMIEIAHKLSVGFPILRVDLYEVNGKIYFGELTFTSQSGCMDYFSQQFLRETGKLIKL